MDRAAFTRAMEPAADERIPCVTPIGYPAAKMSLRESTMRMTIRADERMAFEKLFFASDFHTPLTPEAAGALALPLEMVRLGPSAVNKQPWRLLVCGNAVHFYLRRSRGFTPAPHGDMQMVDMGIALCHFDLTARECALNPVFSLQDPHLCDDMEYIATYTVTLP